MKIAVVFVTVLGLLFGVHALDCVQCLNEKCLGAEATECQYESETQCFAAVVGNGTEVTRLCASESDAKMYCGIAKNNLKDRKGCCYYCEPDGCNAPDSPPKGANVVFNNP